MIEKINKLLIKIYNSKLSFFFIKKNPWVSRTLTRWKNKIGLFRCDTSFLIRLEFYFPFTINLFYRIAIPITKNSNTWSRPARFENSSVFFNFLKIIIIFLIYYLYILWDKSRKIIFPFILIFEIIVFIINKLLYYFSEIIWILFLLVISIFFRNLILATSTG